MAGYAPGMLMGLSLAWITVAALAHAEAPVQPEVAAAATATKLEELQAKAHALDALPLSGPSQGERTEEAITAAVSAQLVAKARALMDLERAVSSVGASSPGRAEALAIYARALEAFATDLRGAYVPSYMSRKERAEYSAALADRALPPEQKALLVWTQVVDASQAPELATLHAQAGVAVERLKATIGPTK